MDTCNGKSCTGVNAKINNGLLLFLFFLGDLYDHRRGIIRVTLWKFLQDVRNGYSYLISTLLLYKEQVTAW